MLQKATQKSYTWKQLSEDLFAFCFSSKRKVSILSVSFSKKQRKLQEGRDGNVFSLLTVCPSYPQRENGLPFLSVCDLSFFPMGNPCTSQLDLEGFLQRERRGLWVPRKQTAEPCADIHATAQIREDCDGTSISGLCPSCPLQGELEAFVIGGAGLAVRSIHPLWMKGEEAPLLGGTLHGFIVSIQSLLAEASLKSSPSNCVSPVSCSLLPGKVHPFQQPQPLRAPPPPLLP